MFLSPGRPTFLCALQTGEHDTPLRKRLAQESRLRRNMLDVEMPIHSRAARFAERLLDRIAIGQGIDQQERRERTSRSIVFGVELLNPGSIFSLFSTLASPKRSEGGNWSRG